MSSIDTLVHEALLRHFTPEEVEGELGSRVFDKDFRLSLALMDFEFFARYYLSHHFTMSLADLHGVLIRDFENLLAAEGEERIVEVVFRGAGKTTIIALAGCLWCVLFRKRHYIMILSRSHPQALEKLSDIKAEIEDNKRIHEDFGNIKGKTWKEEEVITNTGVKISSLGAGQEIRGRKHRQYRPDLFILDDIESKEEVRSPTQRENTDVWLKGDVMRAGSADAKMVVIGNFLAADAIMVELVGNPMFRMTRVFRAINEDEDKNICYASNQDLWMEWQMIVSNLGDPDRADHGLEFFEANKQEMLAGTSVAWPERFPYYDLMTMRLAEGPAAFNTEMMNMPVNPDDQAFVVHYYKKIFNYKGMGSELWLVPWDTVLDEATAWPPVRLSDCVLFAATDPSLGATKTSDYSALVILAQAPSTQGFVLEADIARRLPNRIINDMISWCRKYPQIRRWGSETAAFQLLFSQIAMKRLKEAGVTVPLEPLPITSTNKIGRVMTLQPDLFRGDILLCDKGQELLVRQLENFGHTRYDDGPDALEMVRTMASSWEPPQPAATTVATLHEYGRPEMTGTRARTIQAMEEAHDENLRLQRVEQEEESIMAFPIVF